MGLSWLSLNPQQRWSGASPESERAESGERPTEGGGGRRQDMTYRHTEEVKIIFNFLSGAFWLRMGLCEAIKHNNKLINADLFLSSKKFSTMKNISSSKTSKCAEL